MAQGTRYTNTVFIDIDLIYSEFGAQTFSLPMRGALQKIIEKY